jgi:hypothetical protein
LFDQGSSVEPDEKADGTISTDIDGVLILNCFSCKWDGTYFELAQSTTNPTTGYAIDIPSTATVARGISVDNATIFASGAPTTSTYAINVNFATADVSVNNLTTGSFANPAYVYRAQNLLRASLTGSHLQSSGMLIGSGTPCIDAFSNSNETSGLLPNQACSGLSVFAGQHYGSNAANKDVAGACVLGTSCAVSFLNAYSTAPICLPYDKTTGANAVTISSISGSGVTFTGTGTDTIYYICMGNPN